MIDFNILKHVAWLPWHRYAYTMDTPMLYVSENANTVIHIYTYIIKRENTGINHC